MKVVGIILGVILLLGALFLIGWNVFEIVKTIKDNKKKKELKSDDLEKTEKDKVS